MASIHQFPLKLLRIFRFAREITRRTFGRWALFIAFLDRRLSQLGRSWHGKPGTRPNLKVFFPGNRGRSYSVLGGSTALEGHVVVAASRVPVSEAASEPRSQDEPALANPGPSLIPDRSSIAQPLAHTPSPTHSIYGGTLGGASSGNLSNLSRAGERLSRIMNLRESLRAPVGQPSRRYEAHRLFGRNPGLSSRERWLGSPSLMNRHTSHHWQTPHPVTTDLPTSPARGDGEVSLDSPNPSPPRENSQSSVVHADIQSPSTEPLPISPTIPPLFPHHAEPLSLDTAHSSSVSASAELYPEPPPLSPTASSVTSDFYFPEGRIPQLIHSEQIPRYEKDIKM